MQWIFFFVVFVMFWIEIEVKPTIDQSCHATHCLSFRCFVNVIVEIDFHVWALFFYFIWSVSIRLSLAQIYYYTQISGCGMQHFIKKTRKRILYVLVSVLYPLTFIEQQCMRSWVSNLGMLFVDLSSIYDLSNYLSIFIQIL